MTPAPSRTIRITAGAVSAKARIEAKAETWGDEIRPASPVNVLGRVDGDATVFKKIRAGVPVRIERA